ncbi:HD domain-containing protein [Kutzneria sp. NPDC051319]|uniref:HD domain-containing protein n=1 Tax=Kutzneria sp. NPDC051319 TaxID=3155047 RepID=UPI00344AC893
MDLKAWAFDVAKDVLAEALPRRWAHVTGVAERAAGPASRLPAGDLLVAAAILHDIGYAPKIALTGFHPLDGARYLCELNAPKRLCALVARHSSAVVEAGFRGLEAELEEFPDEESAERDGLWWADMTTTPDGKHTDLNERLREIRTRYGPDHLVTRSIERSTPELTAAVERTCRRLERWNLGV